MIPSGKEKKQFSVLQSGLLIAPLAAFTVSLRHGAALCFAFLLITVPAALLSVLVPRRLPFSVRIVLYSVIGGLVYVPAAVLTVQLFPHISGGIYFALLSSALYLTLLHDKLLPRKGGFRRLLPNLAAVCAAALTVGLIREILGSGTAAGYMILLHPPLPVLLEPSGGLILLIMILTAAAAVRGKGQSDAASG